MYIARTGARRATKTSETAKIVVSKKEIFGFLRFGYRQIKPVQSRVPQPCLLRNGNNPVHELYSDHVSLGEYANSMT